MQVHLQMHDRGKDSNTEIGTMGPDPIGPKLMIGPGPIGPKWTKGPGPIGPKLTMGPGLIGPKLTKGPGPIGPKLTWILLSIEVDTLIYCNIKRMITLLLF